jgi:hypothetical protein
MPLMSCVICSCLCLFMLIYRYLIINCGGLESLESISGLPNRLQIWYLPGGLAFALFSASCARILEQSMRTGLLLECLKIPSPDGGEIILFCGKGRYKRYVRSSQ